MKDLKDQQTFRQTQIKIDQLQKEIDNLQLKHLFSTTLSDKGTANVLESGALIIYNRKGSRFTYCGYFTEHYDLKDGFCYRFIVDDRLTESVLVNHEQAENLEAFITKLGDFFANYMGYNTAYSYKNYFNRLNKSRLNDDIAVYDIDFMEIENNRKIYKALKVAGFNVINF